MGNTLGTTNGTLVAQSVLATLLAEFPLINQISNDFSPEEAKFGQTVSSRVVVAGTAKDYDTTDGYVPDDRTTIDVPVTLNKHKHHTYAVNDQERSSTSRDLIQEFAATGAHALGKQLMDDLFAIILAATFTESYEVAEADFDRDDAVRIGTQLDLLNVLDVNRFMVLQPSFYQGLNLDSTVVSNQINPASNAVETGRVSKLSNFAVSKYSALPENGEKLVGIAGIKDALVLTTRLPSMPSDGAIVPGVIQVVTEPNTGLSLQLRSWYDMAKGKEFRTMTWMYGMAAGLSGTAVSKRMVRIKKP